MMGSKFKGRFLESNGWTVDRSDSHGIGLYIR